MILRVDRWLAELPPPSAPDPEGARVVQELMGGKFGGDVDVPELHLSVVQLP